MFDQEPYCRLMRLHNLTGAWLLLWPCLWSIILASSNILHLLLWIPVFMLGAIIMRSAGCIINDIIDIKLDKQVERTKNRPLANGEVTISQALKLLGILLLGGFIILLTMGQLSVLLGLIAVLLIIIYPLAKYYIKYPQFILGLVFNFGALLGWSAIHHNITLAPILLYAGSFFWIVYYDTIYAHQDKKDDREANVYSTALTFIGSKKWLTKFYRLAIALWGFAGALSQVNIFYYISLVIIIVSLYRQVKRVNLDDPESCKLAFEFNAKIGMILCAGAFLGKIHEFI